MTNSHPLLKLSLLSFLISQTFFTLPAFAAGFQINEISPSLQGNSMAGAAAADNDVSSMFVNPATLSTLLGNQAYFGASEIFPKISMSDARATHTVNIPGIPPSELTATVLGRGSQNNITRPALVPDGYLSWRINNNWVAGVALVAPFGLVTDYFANSVIRFAADYSSVTTININPAVAYTINEQWAVGLGFEAQYIKAILSSFNGPYTGIPDIDELIAADHPTHLEADSWGFGYNIGVLYKPDQCTRVGIGYRSQISEQLDGHGQQYTSPGRPVPAPSNAFLFNAETAVRGRVKTPAVLTFSTARDFCNWTLKASAHINFWDVFNQLSINMPNAFATNTTIQAHWRNTFFGAFGADYHVSPCLTVRGGVAYDDTPTSDRYRDPRIPDADRIWTSVGVSYLLNKQVSIDGVYTHIFAKDQTVNVTQASGTSINSTVPLEVNKVYAKYQSKVDIVGLAVRYCF